MNVEPRDGTEQWRLARVDHNEDDRIVQMCAAFYVEDPAPYPVPPAHMRRTLAALRDDASRGVAVVLEIDGIVCGYALLISSWSNEKGGRVCTIDEFYVAPAHRGRGHGTALIEQLAANADRWLPGVVALSLEVTPANRRARALYERLGFHAANALMVRRLGSV